jgi:hypothetical protein
VNDVMIDLQQIYYSLLSWTTRQIEIDLGPQKQNTSSKGEKNRSFVISVIKYIDYMNIVSN